MSNLNELVDGLAPIHLAAQYGLAEVVEKLIQRGAKVDIKSSAGDSALLISLRCNRLGVYKVLIENGAHEPPKFSSLLFAIMEEKIRLVLPFVYRQFVSDEELFSQLNDICRFEPEHKASVIDILFNFVDQKFPAGKLSKSALKELATLLDTVSASPHLRSEVYAQIMPPINHFDNSWQMWDAQKIAIGLTAIHAKLFDLISLQEVIGWIKNKNSAPYIKETNRLFDYTVNWIAFQIVMENNPKNRRKIAEKFVKIGYELYGLRNYWGVLQVVLAFILPDVSRLAPLKHSKVNKKYETLADLMVPNGNYKNYHNHVASLGSDEKYIPLLNLIFKDFENNENIKSGDISGLLGEMSSMLNNLAEIKKRNINNLKSDKFIVNFLMKIPLIEISTITEFSYLREPSKETRTYIDVDKKIVDWVCSELVSFLHACEIPDAVGIFLESGILNGKSLLAFLLKKKERNEQIELLTNLGIDKAGAIKMVTIFRMEEQHRFYY